MEIQNIFSCKYFICYCSRYCVQSHFQQEASCALNSSVNTLRLAGHNFRCTVRMFVSCRKHEVATERQRPGEFFLFLLI